MIDIDFLPPRFREQSARRQKKVWQMSVLAMFGAAICVAALLQWSVRHGVQQQLAAVDIQYLEAQQTMQRLSQLQADLEQTNKKATLYSYLRHPWPRSQLLAAVVQPVPETITLTSLRLTRESPPLAGAGSVETAPAKPVAKVGELTAKKPPLEADLERLREKAEDRVITMTVEGVTKDSADLHRYVQKLTKSPLFKSVELKSIEAKTSGNDKGQSKFVARIVVRNGYGQPSGPTQPISDGSQLSAASPQPEPLR